MLDLMIICGLVSAFAGLLVKYILDVNRHEFRLTWLEYGIGSVLGSFCVVPVIVYGMYMWAQNSEREYIQFFNGWEVEAIADQIKCSRDGPCYWEYSCDPYQVTVSYSCNCDDKGHCRTCYRQETRYHDCPYCETETTYRVATTLGGYEIAAHRLPLNPEAHRWRKGESIPDYIEQRAGTGPPLLWTEVQKRITKGLPGPVTKLGTYQNYILASDRTILREYAGAIEHYKTLGLLPDIRKALTAEPWFADKVYFVNYRPINGTFWYDSLAYLNASLGTMRQGDMHLVIMQTADKTFNFYQYANALKAYWQDTAVFGRNALAKNTILIVLGTHDGKTVASANVFTGMPTGNADMIVRLTSRLTGAALTPPVIIGKPYKLVTGNGSIHVTGNGILEAALSQFRRVSMGGDGHNDTGFAYLAKETVVPVGEKFFIAVLTLFLSGGLWALLAIIDTKLFWRNL